MNERRDKERTTFLEVSAIVERTHRYAERARDLLTVAMQQADPVDERTRIFLDLLGRNRDELETSMMRAREDLPQRLLESRVQFTIDPWDGDPERPRLTSIEEATRWMLRQDLQLIGTYREIAERSDNDRIVREYFGSLADLLEGFGRRITIASQTSNDV